MSGEVIYRGFGNKYSKGNRFSNPFVLVAISRTKFPKGLTLVLQITAQLRTYSRDSGNYFGRLSVPFLEGRIWDIRVVCNYPTRYTNFKNWILDI